MFTLVLLTALSQGLVSADGATWKHVAVGKPTGGKKFDLYIKLPFAGTKQQPRLTVKTHGGPESVVELDCKAQTVRAGSEEWVKAPAGSIGKALLKYACKR